MLRNIFEQIPYTVLIPIALLLGLAPFQPEPHLIEKLRLLVKGQLQRPLDIFDLLMHGTPLVLLFIKALFNLIPAATGRQYPRDP